MNDPLSPENRARKPACPLCGGRRRLMLVNMDATVPCECVRGDQPVASQSPDGHPPVTGPDEAPPPVTYAGMPVATSFVVPTGEVWLVNDKGDRLARIVNLDFWIDDAIGEAEALERQAAERVSFGPGARAGWGMAAATTDLPSSPGAKIGHENREAVRRFFAAHLGCTNVECAQALGLSIMAVGRHVATLRKEWGQ